MDFYVKRRDDILELLKFHYEELSHYEKLRDHSKSTVREMKYDFKIDKTRRHIAEYEKELSKIIRFIEQLYYSYQIASQNKSQHT